MRRFPAKSAVPSICQTPHHCWVSTICDAVVVGGCNFEVDFKFENEHLVRVDLVLISDSMDAAECPTKIAENLTTKYGAPVIDEPSREMYSPRIPPIDWAGRTEGRGNAGQTANSFFHPSDPSGFSCLIPPKSLI